MAQNLTVNWQKDKIVTETDIWPPHPDRIVAKELCFSISFILGSVFHIFFSVPLKSLQILKFWNCHISPNKYWNKLDIKIPQGTLKKYRIISMDYSLSFPFVRTYKNCHCGKIWNLLKDYLFFSLSWFYYFFLFHYFYWLSIARWVVESF